LWDSGNGSCTAAGSEHTNGQDGTSAKQIIDTLTAEIKITRERTEASQGELRATLCANQELMEAGQEKTEATIRAGKGNK
jgi:hypothetical protein